MVKFYSHSIFCHRKERRIALFAPVCRGIISSLIICYDSMILDLSGEYSGSDSHIWCNDDEINPDQDVSLSMDRD